MRCPTTSETTETVAKLLAGATSTSLHLRLHFNDGFRLLLFFNSLTNQLLVDCHTKMPPQRRKVVSCGTCRRLRTRCEKLPGLEMCRRCDRLRYAKTDWGKWHEVVLLTPCRIRCEFPVIRQSPVETSAEVPRGTAMLQRSITGSQAPIAPEQPIHHIQQRYAHWKCGTAR
jgi:hypothetical protein